MTYIKFYPICYTSILLVEYTYNQILIDMLIIAINL